MTEWLFCMYDDDDDDGHLEFLFTKMEVGPSLAFQIVLLTRLTEGVSESPLCSATGYNKTTEARLPCQRQDKLLWVQLTSRRACGRQDMWLWARRRPGMTNTRHIEVTSSLQKYYRQKNNSSLITSREAAHAPLTFPSFSRVWLQCEQQYAASGRDVQKKKVFLCSELHMYDEVIHPNHQQLVLSVLSSSFW